MNETTSERNRPIVTYGLTLLNGLIFGIMVLRGIHAGNPNPDDLIQWGANFGPATIANQWWRLFSCMFLHAGIVHIVFNGYALYRLGTLVETMVGHIFFLVIYLVSGVMGSLASVWWNPLVVSVGASGAIFGIFGALLTFVFLYRHFIAPEAVAALRKNAIVVLALNFFLGYAVEAIDMAAHVGGFLGGIAVCAVLCRLPRPLSIGRRYRRVAVVLGAALIATVAISGTLPRSAVAWEREVNAFIQADSDITATFNRIQTQKIETDLSNQAFTALYEREVLAPWRQAKARLDSARQTLPSRARQHIGTITRYVDITDNLWQTYHTYLLALQDQEAQQVKAFEKKLAEIMQARKEIAF